MKKYIYSILLGLAVVTAACNRNEANLFNESAAERLETAQKELQTSLLAAENGWEMQYFPYPDAAGYAFLLKFYDDESVVFGGKNPQSTWGMYLTEEATWNVDGTQGCTLTFPTYSVIFTKFADPGSDGTGFNGDYEFVVLKTTANKIELKGKKHGAYITMNRLSEGVDWEHYFGAIDAFNKATFLGNDDMEVSYLDGDSIIHMTYSNGAFVYTDTADVDQNRGFVVTPTGLHFYSGCPISGTNELAKDFVLDEERTKIVCKNHPEVFFASNYTPSEFFTYKFSKYNRWVYTEEGSDSKTVAGINAIRAQAAANGATITRFAFDYYLRKASNRDIKTYGIYISYLADGQLYEGRLICTQRISEGKITYTYASTDPSLEPLLNRIDTDSKAAAKMITDIFCDQYIPESYTGSQINLMELKMQSTTDANKYIHVIADNTK